MFGSADCNLSKVATAASSSSTACFTCAYVRALLLDCRIVTANSCTPAQRTTAQRATSLSYRGKRRAHQRTRSPLGTAPSCTAAKCRAERCEWPGNHKRHLSPKRWQHPNEFAPAAATSWPPAAASSSTALEPDTCKQEQGEVRHWSVVGRWSQHNTRG